MNIPEKAIEQMRMAVIGPIKNHNDKQEARLYVMGLRDGIELAKCATAGEA